MPHFYLRPASIPQGHKSIQVKKGDERGAKSAGGGQKKENVILAENILRPAYGIDAITHGNITDICHR